MRATANTPPLMYISVGSNNTKPCSDACAWAGIGWSTGTGPMTIAFRAAAALGNVKREGAMKRALIIFALAGMLGIASAYVMLRSPVVAPLVSDAQLVPMGAGYALLASITADAPAELEQITVEGASQTTLAGATGPTFIPENTSAALAMDGAHAMVMGLDAEEGALRTVTFAFRDMPAVTTRARVTEQSTMDHTLSYPVPEGEPKPSLEVSLEQINARWHVALKTTDFEFSHDLVDAPHRPGVGHGHVYLNGLKLGRVFGPVFEFGALPAGRYSLLVVLNTNDHRAYEVNGALVQAEADLVVQAE